MCECGMNGLSIAVTANGFDLRLHNCVLEFTIIVLFNSFNCYPFYFLKQHLKSSNRQISIQIYGENIIFTNKSTIIKAKTHSGIRIKSAECFLSRKDEQYYERIKNIDYHIELTICLRKMPLSILMHRDKSS